MPSDESGMAQCNMTRRSVRVNGVSIVRSELCLCPVLLLDTSADGWPAHAWWWHSVVVALLLINPGSKWPRRPTK